MSGLVHSESERQHWRIPPSATLLFHGWDQATAVFYKEAATTHLLDPISAVALQSATRDGLTFDQLLHQTATTLQLPADTALHDFLQQALRRLELRGLLENTAEAH